MDVEKHIPQKIEIRPRKEGEAVTHLHLFVDGTEIRNIRSLNINVEPNKYPTLTLDLNLYDIAIDAECLMYQKGVGAVNFVEAEENPAG